MDNLGEKIKQKRLQKGLSQTELANLLHVSNQLISKWETNRAVPSIEYLKQLCHCRGQQHKAA